jgi:hypothetical protein
MPKLPPCPACGNAKHVITSGSFGRMFCTKHKCEFEPDDEGGDYSDRNPAVRLEREERSRERRSVRRSL